jgi:cell division protease FtsH
LLGGRAAEELVLADLTTGSGNDLEKATEMARRMVCDWGMSDELGPLTFGKREEQIFLGREIAQHRDYSEDTAIKIDQAIRKIVETSHNKAVGLLKEHIQVLHTVANALLEKESLSGEEIDEIVAKEKGKDSDPSNEQSFPKSPVATSSSEASYQKANENAS